MAWPFALTQVLSGQYALHFGNNPSAKTLFKDIPKAFSVVMVVYKSYEIGSTGIKYGTGNMVSSVIKPAGKFLIVEGLCHVASFGYSDAGRWANSIEMLARFLIIVEKDQQKMCKTDKKVYSQGPFDFEDYGNFMVEHFNGTWVAKGGLVIASKTLIADQIGEVVMKNGEITQAIEDIVSLPVVKLQTTWVDWIKYDDNVKIMYNGVQLTGNTLNKILANIQIKIEGISQEQVSQIKTVLEGNIQFWHDMQHGVKLKDIAESMLNQNVLQNSGLESRNLEILLKELQGDTTGIWQKITFSTKDNNALTVVGSSLVEGWLQIGGKVIEEIITTYLLATVMRISSDACDEVFDWGAEQYYYYTQSNEIVNQEYNLYLELMQLVSCNNDQCFIHDFYDYDQCPIHELNYGEQCLIES